MKLTGRSSQQPSASLGLRLNLYVERLQRGNLKVAFQPGPDAGLRHLNGGSWPKPVKAD